MDKDGTDQQRDYETGHWVSDLRPGATHEAKVDKGVEDTFPASDPAHKSGATGLILPDGKDTAVHGHPAEQARRGSAEALGPAGQAEGAAMVAINQ